MHVQVHVFDVYDAASDRNHFYVWDEKSGGSGADEVISVILHHFDTDIVRQTLGAGVLVIWADNCPGQNKHQFMMAFAHELSDPNSSLHHFRRVDVRFPVKGHTFLVCDRAFSVIERFAGGRRIQIPEHLVDAISRSFQTFQYVERIERSKFETWKDHFASKYSMLGRTLLFPHGSQKLQFQNISIASFGEFETSRHVGEMWFKYSLREDASWRKIKIIKANGS